MRKINNLKSGFSLMEMMVVLLITAIVAAASAPMISQKKISNSSPWKRTGENGSIVYNATNSDIRTAFIGPITTFGSARSKLFISSNADNPVPHIGFRHGDKPEVQNNTSFPGENNLFFRFANKGISLTENLNTLSKGTVAIGVYANFNVNSVEDSIAIGPLARGGAPNAIALGYYTNTYITGDYSPSSGNSVGDSSVSIGVGPSSKGDGAVCIGNGARAKGDNSIAIGTSTNQGVLNLGPQGIISDTFSTGVGGGKSVALGNVASARNQNAIVIGNNARAYQTDIIAIGAKAEASRKNAIAIGHNTKTMEAANAINIGYKNDPFGLNPSEDSITIGTNAMATEQDSIAIGNRARGVDKNAIAIGINSNIGVTGGQDSIAIGTQTKASAQNAIAIGTGANTNLQNSIVIGPQASRDNEVRRILIGNNQQVNSDGTERVISIGSFNPDGEVLGLSTNNSIAIGSGGIAANSGNSISIGIGSQIESSSPSSIAIGDTAKVIEKSTDSIAIGHGAEAGKATEAEESENRDSAIAIGNAKAVNSESIAIGDNTTASGKRSIAIGFNNRSGQESDDDSVNDYTIALGGNAKAIGKYSIAIGFDDKEETLAKGEKSIAIGCGAKAEGEKSIALGTKAVAKGENSVAIGNGAHADNKDEIVLGTESTTVRIWGTLKASTSSDRRLKNIGEVFKGGLAELKKLKFFHYTFKKDEEKIPHVGVIAQDLIKVFPDAVLKGKDGFYRIRTEYLFYAVINAVKELDERLTAIVDQVQSLVDRVDILEAQVNVRQEVLETYQKQNAEFEKQLAKLEKKYREKNE